MPAPAPAASHELLERDDELDRLGQLTADAARGRGAVVVLEGPAGHRQDQLVGGGGAARRCGRSRRARRPRWRARARLRVRRRAPVARATGRPCRPRSSGSAGWRAQRRSPGRCSGWRASGTSVTIRPPLRCMACTGSRRTSPPTRRCSSPSTICTGSTARRCASSPTSPVASRSSRSCCSPPAARRSNRMRRSWSRRSVADPSVCRVEPAPLSLAAVRDLVTRRGRGELAESVHAATGGNPFLVGALLDVLDERVAADDVPVVGARVGDPLRRRPPRSPRTRRAGVGPCRRRPRDRRRATPRVRHRRAHRRRRRYRRGRPGRGRHPRRPATARVRPPDRSRPRSPSSSRHPNAPGATSPRRTCWSATAATPSASPRTCSPPTHEPTRGWWRRWPLPRPGSSERGAPDAAVRYLRRALDEPPSADARPALLAQLGRAEIRAAMPDDAVEHLRAAMSATDSPHERALMAHDLAIGLIAPGRYEEAVQMLDQALESAGDVDPELRRRLEAELLCAARLDAGTLDDRPPRARRPAGEHPRRHAGRTDAARRARPRARPARRDGDRGPHARRASPRRRADRRADRRLRPRHGRRLRDRHRRRPRAGGSLLGRGARRRPPTGLGHRVRPHVVPAGDAAPRPGPAARRRERRAQRHRRWRGSRATASLGWLTRRSSRRSSPRASSTPPTPRSPPPGSTATSPTATCSTSSSSHEASCASHKAATPRPSPISRSSDGARPSGAGSNPAVFPYRSLLALAGVPDAPRLAAEEVRARPRLGCRRRPRPGPPGARPRHRRPRPASARAWRCSTDRPGGSSTRSR